jgi:hypothetical protein
VQITWVILEEHLTDKEKIAVLTVFFDFCSKRDTYNIILQKLKNFALYYLSQDHKKFKKFFNAINKYNNIQAFYNSMRFSNLILGFGIKARFLELKKSVLSEVSNL